MAWSSSGLLAPVLQRVYRRFGIAGVAPRKSRYDKPELVVARAVEIVEGAATRHPSEQSQGTVRWCRSSILHFLMGFTATELTV